MLWHGPETFRKGMVPMRIEKPSNGMEKQITELYGKGKVW